MEKYTWGDIINPSSEQAKSYIGKRCYFANTPNQCLKIANSGDDVFCFILEKIKPTYDFPFVSNNGFTGGCIIPKKEESQKDKHKKYVPFLNKEEFLSAYEEHTKNMKKYGIWIFRKMNGKDDIIPCLITEMWSNGLIIGGAAVRTLWKYILECFVFEDGTPCGKEIKE